MKFFIFVIFFNIIKANANKIYKTKFIHEFANIVEITESSIDFYIYLTEMRKSTSTICNFENEEQKISSSSEGDMISISYNVEDTNYKQLYIIVKNYLYIFFTSQYIDYIKFDYLKDIYSTLVSDKCVGEEGENHFCHLYISFINSENKLNIYKYKFLYNKIEPLNYSFIKLKEIDLINSSGQISLNICKYISCQKAKNESSLDVLVCFYENDNSEIAAITLNLDTLVLEKEVAFKKNSGAKNIKSVLFANNEKVFVCYINKYDNVACITFDEPQNIFLLEFKYIEKMTQSQRYFNIDYFSPTNQYILSTYSSETEFEYIIFDENMNILDENSIKNIKIDPCIDESSPLSITIYHLTNYKIAKRCGNETFSSNEISEVSSNKSFSIEKIVITDNLIGLPYSNLITDKSLTDTIYSSNDLNGYLTDRISLTTTSETNSSSNFMFTSIPSEEKASKGGISDSIISYDDISNNFQTIDIFQSSSIKSDKISTDIKSNIGSETISSSDVLSDEISSNTKLTDIKSNIPSEIISTSNEIIEEISTNTKIADIKSNIASESISPSKDVLSDEISTNTELTDIKSNIASDKISTSNEIYDEISTNTRLANIKSNLESEIISTSNDIYDKISSNTKLTNLLSDKISTNIKSSNLLSDNIITDTKSSSILSDENFSFFKDEDINLEGKTIKIRTNKTLELLINNLERLTGEINIEDIYEITADHFKMKISPINYKKFGIDNSFINFLDCENTLRKANNLLPNDTLTEVMIEIDKNDDKSLTNQIEYAVFYGKKQLDLSVCANNEIEVNYDISNSTLVNFRMISDFSKLGVDILNSKDKFFNDICYPYSENNSDMILKDRISDIYQNYSKCDENCEYKKIDINSNLITCNCKIKSKINKEIEPPRLESIILDLVTDSSFGVVKCPNLVFNFHNKAKNIGFWIFAIAIIAHIVIIIHYSINTINPISRYIISQMKKFSYITKIYNPVKKKKSNKKSQFNIYNNVPINLININQIENKSTHKESFHKFLSIKKRKTHFNNRIANKLDNKNSSSTNKNFDDFSAIKLKKKSKTTLLKNNNNCLHKFYEKQEKQKKLKKSPTKIKDKKTNQKNDKANEYNLIQISANNSPNNTPPNSNCFLDNYNYREAIKYDKRTFCRIYYICILAKENILNIILINSPLELKSLRICLLIFAYSCDFALNTLFYFNSNISDKYYYNGNNKFFYTIFNNISISVISTFISLVLLIFFKILTNSKDSIEELFRKEERKMRKNSNYVVNFIKRKQILMNVYEINKILKIKIIIFFIIEFSIMLFFFYFVTAFCEVYKQSQISWISDSLVSFFLSFPIEFGTAFLIAVFYKISVQKKCKLLYKIIMIFYNLG